ncbi:unnamed protein product, partial [Amoebophrya sp. A25]
GTCNSGSKNPFPSNLQQGKAGRVLARTQRCTDGRCIVVHGPEIQEDWVDLAVEEQVRIVSSATRSKHWQKPTPTRWLRYTDTFRAIISLMLLCSVVFEPGSE